MSKILQKFQTDRVQGLKNQGISRHPMFWGAKIIMRTALIGKNKNLSVKPNLEKDSSKQT